MVSALILQNFSPPYNFFSFFGKIKQDQYNSIVDLFGTNITLLQSFIYLWPSFHWSRRNHWCCTKKVVWISNQLRFRKKIEWTFRESFQKIYWFWNPSFRYICRPYRCTNDYLPRQVHVCFRRAKESMTKRHFRYLQGCVPVSACFIWRNLN